MHLGHISNMFILWAMIIDIGNTFLYFWFQWNFVENLYIMQCAQLSTCLSYQVNGTQGYIAKSTWHTAATTCGHAHTHIHTQTHTHTNKHTYTHTHSYTHTQSHTDTHRQTNTHTHTHSYTHIHTNTQTQTLNLILCMHLSVSNEVGAAESV